MRINIKDIKPEGIEIDDEISQEKLGVTEEDFVHFITPLKIHAKIERVNNTVLAKIYASGRFKTYCARTLEPLQRDWSDNFYLDFEINKTTEYIELDDDIRQEVVLRLPVRVLSDSEQAKEQKEGRKKKEEIVEDPYKDNIQKSKTYRPFENLPDLE